MKTPPRRGSRRQSADRVNVVPARSSLRFEQLEDRRLLAAVALGNETLVNDFLVRDQSQAAATIAGNGNLITAFAGKGPVDRNGVFAKVASADGSTLLPSFRVNATIRGAQYLPDVAADAQGNFVVAWTGRGAGDKRGIFFQRFNAAGVRQGNETRVNQTAGGDQAEPAVAMADDGSFTVTWSGVGNGDFAGVFLRRFSSAGVPLSSEILVNEGSPGVPEAQSEPAVALDASGNLAVAWTSRHQDGSDLGVFARRFDAGGAPLGDEFGLSTTTENSQSTPALATDPTGGFFAAWTSFGQDGDLEGVVGRAFSGSGAEVVGEQVLNDQAPGRQRDPAVAIDASGNVLVAFASGIADGSGWEVLARSLEPDFSPDGDSVAVNQQFVGPNSGPQRSPDVAAADATAVVLWSGRGVGDHDGVFLQQYTTDEDGPQQPPTLLPIADQDGVVGEPFSVTVAATDPNENDLLTIFLDPDSDGAPPTATVMQTPGERTAVIRYTPTPLDAGESILFTVLVTDNGEPPLPHETSFVLNVAPATQGVQTIDDGRGIDPTAVDAALEALL